MEETRIDVLRTQARIELDRLEAHATAKEVAAKAIGKSAIMWIVLLVLVGVGSAAFLPSESLAPVIGLVATAAMALIQLVNGIVNEAKTPEKPEITIIKELIARLDQKEPPMQVSVEGDRVTVTKGDDTIQTRSA